MIKREVVKELVLALLYITSWEENEYDYKYNRSWKGYPFELMDELKEENLISGSNRGKSIYLSDNGVKKALEIIDKYNFEKEDVVPKKKKNIKKKKSNKNNEKEVWTEEEYDEYMAGLYGLDSIAGYTDGGIPFGVSNDEIEEGKDDDTFIDSDDEIPF